MWGECLLKLQENEDHREMIARRVKVQVWDSVGGIDEIPIGYSRAIFPSNLIMQRVTRKLIQRYLDICHNVSTKHYQKSGEIFHAKPLQAPALLFFSFADPVGTEQMQLKIRESLEKKQIEVKLKSFSDSPHVQHFRLHKAEYTKCLVDLLESCDLVTNKSE